MPAKKTKPSAHKTIAVKSLHSPGYTAQLNAQKYTAMYRALVKVLPSKPPGLTQAEMFSRVKPHLPASLFPGGATASWWVKAVQLDQETKGTILREKTKPVRWYRKKGR